MLTGNTPRFCNQYLLRLMAQLASDGFCGQLHPVLPPALVNIFCAAINNAEQVRRSLAIVDKLHLDELCEGYMKITKQRGEWRATVEQDLENCEKYIGEQINSTAGLSSLSPVIF